MAFFFLAGQLGRIWKWRNLVPGMQQVLIKVSCCHDELLHSPPLLERFSGAGRGRDQSEEPRSCHCVGRDKKF